MNLIKRIKRALEILFTGTDTSGSAGSGSGQTARPVRWLENPMGLTTGAETQVAFVSRWGLAEFGVKCSRCGADIASTGSFHRIYDTNLGEAIDCMRCGCACVASPVTEYGEHKLPQTPDLKTFSRVRHELSPVSSAEASTMRINMAKGARVSVKDFAPPKPLMDIATAQSETDCPPDLQHLLDLQSTTKA